MLLDVSTAEAIDKLSILELKLKKITNTSKLVEIQKEYDYLYDQCANIKYKYISLYKLLLFINEYIWDKQDIIKCMEPTQLDFATISNTIFQYNDKRFRIKNIINNAEHSNLKEQKGYANKHIHIYIPHDYDMAVLIPKLHYLILEYDTISFDTSDILTQRITHMCNYSTFLYIDDTRNIVPVNIDSIVFPNDFSFYESI